MRENERKRQREKEKERGGEDRIDRGRYNEREGE